MKRILIILCVLCLSVWKGEGAAYAKEDQAAANFSGDVAMLKKEENGYVMQVTVENSGEDFTGVVQVVFSGADTVNCAYNTEIALPAEGKKQFTVNITGTVADMTRGICALRFLDADGNVLQSIELKNVFGNMITEVPVGVLSEDFAALAYLEAKGETIDIRDGYYPVELKEMSGDTLKEELNGLVFLVIDRYDVSSLGKENIEAIQNWVKDGGWLMIGTGAYGQETLSGFDKDFLDLKMLSVSEPGEENFLSRNAYPNGYDYYAYTDDGIDFAEMAVADLDSRSNNGEYYESSENPSVCVFSGQGAVLVFYCALGDKELQKVSGSTVSSMYRELTYDYYGHFPDRYSEWDYIMPEALSLIDKINTNVDFTGLKGMILLYAVLVGPVLYLLLRRCKKPEWYWICAPVLGILFIGGVYVLGLGARVNEAKVYSVTAQEADGERTDTYLLAYHSGTKPWEIGLKKEYRTAGPGSRNSYYYGGYHPNTNDYFYVVSQGGDGLSVGVKPEENFDSGFFYAEGSGKSRGSLSGDDLESGREGMLSGTVTNGTDCDMSYIAVCFQDTIMVFSDVGAGETIDLQGDLKNRCVYANTAYSTDDLLYDMVSVYDYGTRSELGYEQDDMAALLIGLGAADREKPSGPGKGVILGVVRDYDKAAVGKCSEISYGCLYSYLGWEGGRNASN